MSDSRRSVNRDSSLLGYDSNINGSTLKVRITIQRYNYRSTRLHKKLSILTSRKFVKLLCVCMWNALFENFYVVEESI
jgi:hypothetical protein